MQDLNSLPFSSSKARHGQLTTRRRGGGGVASNLLAAAVGVLDLGPRDHHGHRIVALRAAAAVMTAAGVAAAHGAVLPGAAALVGVPTGTGMEVGSGTAWRLLNAWPRDHVVRLSLHIKLLSLSYEINQQKHVFIILYKFNKVSLGI